MKKLSKIVPLTTFGLLLAIKAFSNNVDAYGIGVKAISLGGAYTVWEDDPFALYYNPAGLAQIDKPEIILCFENVKPFLNVNSMGVDGTNFGSFTYNSTTMTIPNFGVALPVSKTYTGLWVVY